MAAGATGDIDTPRWSRRDLSELCAAFEHLRATLDDLGAQHYPPDHGHLLTDAEGRILYFSSHLEGMLRLDGRSFLGVALRELVVRFESRPGFPEGNTEAPVTVTFRLPEGVERFFRYRSVPLAARDGHPAGTLHTFQDVTAAAEHARELAGKIRELDEARASLSRAQHLKALGQLAAEVAHEFGNLLQAIGLQSAALRRQAQLPESVVRAVWSIKQAVDLGQALTRRLLTFARNDPTDEVGPIDIARVLRDLVQLVEPRITGGESQIHIELSLQPLPEVRGNPNKLTEAFLNILLNAMDAMPQGGTLRISAVERSGEIRIAVRDSGKGMAREELARAFDPFFTTKPGGTGLGLSTVDRVVRAHGGSVFLDSEPGKGTSVFVSLPIASPVEEKQPGPAGRPSRGEHSVLVVDDHPAVREATAELLGGQGYVVETAATVADALAAIERRPFAAVVTDVGLPDRAGWEVVRAAKQRSRQTLVVLVSGWGSHFSPEDVRARGVDLVLVKPVDPDELLSAIDRGVRSSTAA